MCGRFSLKTADVQKLAKRFKAAPSPRLPAHLEPRYNIAPVQHVLVVRTADAARELVQMKWGLIPHWVKDASIMSRLINARSETVAERPAYRVPFQSKRCLVPCDAFYEWKGGPGGKHPFAFTLPDDHVFALAGLWDSWLNPETNETLETVVLLTTTANRIVAPIHDRMPVLLREADEEDWLHAPPASAKKLLKPYDGEMKCTPVSRRLNSAKIDNADVLIPFTPDLL